jgi:hypothetical protein
MEMACGLLLVVIPHLLIKLNVVQMELIGVLLQMVVIILASYNPLHGMVHIGWLEALILVVAIYYTQFKRVLMQLIGYLLSTIRLTVLEVLRGMAHYGLQVDQLMVECKPVQMVFVGLW